MLTLLLISGATAFTFALVNPGITYIEDLIGISMKLFRALSCLSASFLFTYFSSAPHDRPLYGIAGAFFGYFLVSLGESMHAEPSVVHAVGRER